MADEERFDPQITSRYPQIEKIEPVLPDNSRKNAPNECVSA
jgi:hypothetical protein